VKESYATGFDASSFTYKFSTKPLDLATGLYYYGYRWYDPVIGRWPSRDPIEEMGGINLYGFVGNDGVNYIDINGLAAFAMLVSNQLGENDQTLVENSKFLVGRINTSKKIFTDALVILTPMSQEDYEEKFCRVIVDFKGDRKIYSTSEFDVFRLTRALSYELTSTVKLVTKGGELTVGFEWAYLLASSNSDPFKSDYGTWGGAGHGNINHPGKIRMPNGELGQSPFGGSYCVDGTCYTNPEGRLENLGVSIGVLEFLPIENHDQEDIHFVPMQLGEILRK
jgi:RHS repeat-associated protein